RVMAVLDPIKVVIENYPEGEVEQLEAVNNPEDPSAGSRQVPFSREIYIEREDFREDPPRKYHRLAPGREVRLRWGYFLSCKHAVKDASGNIVELRCTYDPDTKGGKAPDGRKVKGTIHWVSTAHAIDADVRLYDRLFHKENPEEVEEGQEFTANLNPESLQVLHSCKLEPSLAEAAVGTTYQFERLGYFTPDCRDSKPGALVFNRTVQLRDSWAKIEKKQNKTAGKGNANSGGGKPEGVALIGIDDFTKLQLKTAKVLEAEVAPDSDRLLKLQVQIGDEKRQIVAGIANHYAPEDMVGKTVIVVANLKPAVIRGIQSQGMLLAAKKKKKLRLLTVDSEIATGATVG
ncbi:MAG: methionine--tRNA ligase subunit beta, partial [Lentisphaeria bacterium]|nr:methionine--tRNA ligase subunit beta [Lentisphaeria bacterium]